MATELKLEYASVLYYDIFSFKGEMTVSSLVPVTAELNGHIDKTEPRTLVIDLSGTSHIDSSGIKLIVNLKKKIDFHEKGFFLLAPSQEVRSILEETNMLNIFNILDSSVDLEKYILAEDYKTYFPFTEEENGMRRINGTCAICGSNEIVGYLFDQNTFNWRWVEDNPFPDTFDKKSDKKIDFLNLSPIICTECYMASIRISDFNIIDNNEVVVKSSLHDDSKNVLAKSIKKRKKMMELDVDIDETFFQFPRDNLAAYKAYELAELCARNISVMKKDATPFDVGYLDYLAILFADNSLKEIHINNCRTWFTQAMNKPEELTTFKISVCYFVLIVANLNLYKKQDAAKMYTDFQTFIDNLPSSTPQEGLASPAFWHNQIKLIWKNEIEAQSQAMQIKNPNQ